MKARVFTFLLVAVFGFSVGLHAVGFVTFSSPDATYLGATTEIDISGIPCFDDVASVSDGTLTVGFSSLMNKRIQPDCGWATWSSPPDSQQTSPHDVLYSQGASSVTMAFSVPLFIFGFEAEPNPFAVHDMRADFYDAGAVLLGSITRSVDGAAGARLFAASDDPFAFVVFTDLSGTDFGMAHLRYSTQPLPAPEPATLLLLGSGLIGLGFSVRRRISS